MESTQEIVFGVNPTGSDAYVKMLQVGEEHLRLRFAVETDQPSEKRFGIFFASTKILLLDAFNQERIVMRSY